MSVTKAKTAEDLLMIFAELIQEFNSPDEVDGVDDGLLGDVRADEVTSDSTAAADGHTTPWADLTGLTELNLLYKMPPEVVAKMNWVIDNVPKMNRQRIVRDAVNAFLDGLIQKHYKPE